MYEDKNVEFGVIASTDTIVDPGTVVIVSVYAATTQVTMLTARGANNFAVRAETDCVERKDKFAEVDFRVTLKSAWIREPYDDP